MKTLFAFIVCLSWTSSLSAQKITRKVVPVLTQQNFFLNGGMNASMQGGKSRQLFKVTLPPNTVEWYYTFSTFLQEGDNGVSQLELTSQLSRAFDPTGISAVTISSLLAPPGVAYADIYLMNTPNAQVFINKGDNQGQTLSRILEGSRENFKNGVVRVAGHTQGILYLGIKNPATMSGINVSLEIAAIVEEQVQQSEAEQKGVLYGKLGWEAFQKGNYAECINYSQKALSFDSEMPWVKCNIALCHLVQEKAEYLESYIDAITCCKRSPQASRYLRAAIDDINTVGLKTEHAEQIVRLIRSELIQ